MDLAKIDDFDKKRQVLNCLEENQGSMAKTCAEIGVHQEVIESWCVRDKLFKADIQRIIKGEKELKETGKIPGYVAAGVRPFDLFCMLSVSSKTKIKPALAIKMWKILKALRMCNWKLSQACRDTGISYSIVSSWKVRFPIFCELIDAAEQEALQEIYDIAKERAMDVSPAGDAMRKFILSKVGHKVGLPREHSDQTKVEVNITRSVDRSEAIVRAHEKAIENSINIVAINE